ncbi:MAG: DUF5320 domain-containing protein [Phycisphaerae bacterium]|nr:DUF5320 domain-containing protein [Phycisphaerae bacterium]
MPGGDRTGPNGMGPMTGRAAGLCVGNPGPGYMNPTGGFGFGRMGGRGGGGGRGRRNRFYATGLTGWQRAGMNWTPNAVSAMTGEPELAVLRRQADSLGRTLAEIQRRIAELETNSAASGT